MWCGGVKNSQLQANLRGKFYDFIILSWSTQSEILLAKIMRKLVRKLLKNWVHVSPGLIFRDEERQVEVVEIACAFLGEFLLGDSNV